MKSYKIGDRFRNLNNLQEYILVSMYPDIYKINAVCLVNLLTGKSHSMPVTVEDVMYITQTIFDVISNETYSTKPEIIPNTIFQKIN